MGLIFHKMIMAFLVSSSFVIGIAFALAIVLLCGWLLQKLVACLFGNK